VAIQGYSPDGITQYWNQTSQDLYGYSTDEAIGRNLLELIIPPEMQAEVRQAIASMAETGQPIPASELSLMRCDGSRVPVFSNHVIIDVPGRLPELFCVDIDLTERKRVEQDLRQSEERHRKQIELAMDGILLLSAEGLVTAANKSMCTILGVDEQAIHGRHLNELPFTPESVHAFPLCLEMLRGGEIVNSDRTLLRSDGTRVAVEMRTGLLPDGTIQSIFRDISKRKQDEERLAAALAEKEVLLREVHHRVKNNLAAIISLLDMQRRFLQDPEGKTVLAELGTRIRSMSLIHEKLYRSSNLARIQFQDYLKALLSHLRTSFGSPCIECVSEAAGVELPLDLAVPCGMIINELVTNAMKYAFPNLQPGTGSHTCRIRVDMRHGNGMYHLSVADNGVGLPVGFDWLSAKTLGMTLIRMLGRHQLGGQLALDQDQETRFTLTFPAQRGKP
jgi:PAS domain S-box-containing protein